MCEGKKTGELDNFRGYTGKYHEHGYTRDRVGGSEKWQIRQQRRLAQTSRSLTELGGQKFIVFPDRDRNVHLLLCNESGI